MATHKQGDEIRKAIASRDVALLRRMAAKAENEEGRMWMTLLARMLELDATRRRRPRSTRPIVGIHPRRDMQRRAARG